jgi:hypothetical protein
MGRPGSIVPSLHRPVRSLASLGILTEMKDKRFGLTTIGEALKIGAPGVGIPFLFNRF